MNFFLRLLTAGLMLLALNVHAARNAPIVNYENQAALGASGEPVSADQIRKALPVAGAKRGWAITPAGPGKMVGTLQIRNHTATIDIGYSAGKYSIKYKDSSNLNYEADEAGGRIHPNYNGWVQNLVTDIRVQLIQP